ncbi:MAG: EAL domain-containing protein [Acidobacteriia bacterium]|nr:EAL domain-containing protein [Terriglobia bacterium]
MELFVARQPIFDAHMNVFGYEALFRSGMENVFDGSEGNTATAKVISALLGSVEGERLMGGRPAFLNFPRMLLVEEAASILPPETTVIEILETVEPDAEVVAACHRLRARGYRLALDDFIPTAAPNPLTQVVDILKVDFRLTSPSQQQLAVDQFGSQLQLLAEKVETREEFQRASRMGYQYFQGFFFARPAITVAHQIDGWKLNYLRILQELHHPQLDYARLTELLRREHALSYKLLRFVNSALFARREPIESLHHALAFAGEEAARKWLSVVTLLDLASDQPTELAVNTLVRARFAELLAPVAGLRGRSEDCFLMGMFSRLDAMMGRPMEELLAGLNLHEEIARVLLGRPHSDDRLPAIWEMVEAYETADWVRTARLSSALHLATDSLTSSYTEAVGWADAACH